MESKNSLNLQPETAASIDIIPATRALRRRTIGWKKLVLLACCIVTVVVGWWLRSDGVLEPAVLLGYREQHPVSFAVAFVAVYTLSVLGTVPTLPLNLVAGALWGPFLGGIIATGSMALAASLAFFSARYLLGQPLARRFDNLFVTWLQKEFDAKGWRFVAFLRLNPVFPTGPLNYVLGLTSIHASTYVWATFVFLLPPATAVALVGSSMGSLFEGNPIRSAFKAASLFGVAATLFLAARYGAKYFHHKRTNDHNSSGAHAE